MIRSLLVANQNYNLESLLLTNIDVKIDQFCIRKWKGASKITKHNLYSFIDNNKFY